ncbi:dynein axonemal intermediate chain 7 isoform X2 [Erinaceus europaeus]|nr:dynein axonemal intermediate chain 7 isoform X2 [Erinaceus europaeus]
MELEELTLLELCFPYAERLKQEDRALAQWKHYIQCDGSPDPSVAPEINTFISLWKEETNETFEEVIEKSKLVLSLIETLKLVLRETPPSDLSEKNVAQYQGSILELQELLQLKFNIATEILLRHASTLADLDSGNMEKIIQDENVTLYVWANLKKNPRYRTIKFSDTQIGFEIPRVLATSDIALRLLHTCYDHVSPLRPAPAASQEKALEEEQDVGTAEAAGQAQEALEEAPQLPNNADTSETRTQEAGDPQEEAIALEDSEAQKSELGLKLLSAAVLEAQLLLLENVLEKPMLFEDNEVDLCQFMPLGGIYHLDILELPPQCRPIRGWVMVQILKEGLQKHSYPPDTMEDSNDAENNFPPIEVTLKVHQNVIFFEDPMVARWDAEDQHWKTDGISNVVYASKQKLITFSLDTLGPVTLIQDAHVHMPYQSWELQPLDEDKVLLTVTTVFAEMQIHIKEELFMLAAVKLGNKERVSLLEGKWMTHISFITALKEAGLNIFPSNYSHFYVIINNKFASVELKAYRQMALLSSAFAYGWSKWNLLCDSHRVVFKVREHLSREVEPTQLSNWSLLMFSGDRAQVLRINEHSDTFSEALKENTEFHSTLYHMVKEFASPAALDKAQHCSPRLVDSVCTMLLSTRVLSYS